MADFYRGKRVSEYRKQSHSYQAAGGGGTGVKFELSVGPGDRVRAIKNIRALVTVSPYDSSPYNNWSAGFVCMFRCPLGDYPSGILNMEASAVLHPVPFAMSGAPLTLAYEFGGITVGQAEEVWMTVQSVIGSGQVGVVISALWAQKDTLTP